MEIPPGKRIFPAKLEAAPLPRKAAGPSRLRSVLGRLFQAVGKRTESLGERLLAGQSGQTWPGEAWRTAGCDG